jgi:hypothetical protein
MQNHDTTLQKPKLIRHKNDSEQLMKFSINAEMNTLNENGLMDHIINNTKKNDHYI